MRPPFARQEAPQRDTAPSRVREREREREPAYFFVDDTMLDSMLDSTLDSTLDGLNSAHITRSRGPKDAEQSRATASVPPPLSPVLGGSCSLGSVASLSSSPRNLSAVSIGNYAESHAEAGSGLPLPGHRRTETPSEASSRVPHLVMPSIMMPSRRPFTDVGKTIGRLTIMVVGESGTGKTSLIKAIVQSCEHIVHVDPIDIPSNRTITGPESNNAAASPSSQRNVVGRTREIHASTKPFPTWWTEWDRHKQSTSVPAVDDGAPVLERNIRFIDTMGYRSDASSSRVTGSISQYVEAQLARNSLSFMDNAEHLKMLSSGGSSVVDVVIFLISETGLRPADVELLRRLAPLTNIVPVVAKADAMSQKQLSAVKKDIVRAFVKHGISRFRFSNENAAALQDDEDGGVYAISNLTGSDHDVIDASVLMSSEYMEPLVPTDLPLLVRRVFCEDGSAQLRHAAARKCVRWADDHREKAQTMALIQPRQQYHYQQQQQQQQQQQSLSINRIHFQRPWLLDHEDFARPVMDLDLRDWATNLRQSLEKARPQDRMISWPALTGTGSPSTAMARRHGGDATWLNRKGRGAGKKKALSPQQDPLGLLQMAGEAQRTGMVALEVIGGVGMMGIFSWLATQKG